MSKLIIIATFVLINLTATSQSFNWKRHEIKSDTDLLKTTTWVYTGNQTGTAYYFYSKIKKQLFLITNRHIVENATAFVFGYHTAVRADSLFGIDSIKFRTTYHPNSNIDLAAVRLDNISYLDLSISTYFKCFTEDNYPNTKDSLSLDVFNNKIVALSYPGLTTIPFPFQPYIIHCNLSVPYSFSFQFTDDIILDGNLTHGCSGSPIVFIKKIESSKRYCLLGTYYFSFANYQTVDSVYNDTLNYAFNPVIDRLALKNSIPITLDGFKYNQLLNIGRAVKSAHLKELINQNRL